jgi:hypothetical protein
MTKLNNLFEIYKLLDKSNCRKCNEKTCMAFAGAVYQNRKQLNECPSLDHEIIERYSDNIYGHETPGQVMEKSLEQLKQEIQKLDLSAIAQQIGGIFSNGKLTIKSLGKNYHIYPNGNISSEIHMNLWILIPLAQYIVDYQKDPIKGKWVAFRELPNGEPRHLYFKHRCENTLKIVADTYTRLFEDMIHVFNGKQVENHNQSDISLVLYPLPKLPVLISYWKPDGDFESDFTFCFDSSAEKNLDIESIFTICSGIAIMFQKLSIRHN